MHFNSLLLKSHGVVKRKMAYIKFAWRLRWVDVALILLALSEHCSPYVSKPRNGWPCRHVLIRFATPSSLSPSARAQPPQYLPFRCFMITNIICYCCYNSNEHLFADRQHSSGTHRHAWHTYTSRAPRDCPMQGESYSILSVRESSSATVVFMHTTVSPMLTGANKRSDPSGNTASG